MTTMSRPKTKPKTKPKTETKTATKTATAALAAVLWITAAAAGQGVDQSQPRGDASEAAKAAWHGASGDFEAALVLARNSSSFIREWGRGGAAEEGAEIPSVSSVHRGESVDAVVLFKRCTPKSTGHCDSEVDFRVLRPDGSLYTKFEEVELWKNQLVPLGSRLRAGQTSLELEIEPADPLGTYRVEAVVRDLVSGREMRLVRELEVLEAVEP